MRGVPAADVREMRHAEVTTASTPAVTAASAAPAVTASAASAATTPSSAAASPATALAGERQIRGANRNPERADSCGKPRHDKPADKSFADPLMTLFLPQKGLSSGARPTRF